jgi:hypothetical protein
VKHVSRGAARPVLLRRGKILNAGVPSSGDWYAKIHAVYRRAREAHVPLRYAGRVTLLWPDQDMSGYRGDPTWGWGRVARVDVHAVPGDHHGAITTHVEALANCLKGCLNRAQAGEVEGERKRPSRWRWAHQRLRDAGLWVWVAVDGACEGTPVECLLSLVA